MNILFNKSALEYALKQLEHFEDYSFCYVHELNKGRYFFVEGFGCDNIGVIYHREFFQKYGEWARSNKWVDKNGKIKTGLGESINVDHLKKFISKDVKRLIYVYPDGKIYKIDILSILTEGDKWTQKEGTEVYSFSIHLMQRLAK